MLVELRLETSQSALPFKIFLTALPKVMVDDSIAWFRLCGYTHGWEYLVNWLASIAKPGK